MSGKHPWILLAALLALGAAATASCGGGGNDGDADVIATPDGDATTTSSPDSRLDVSPTGRPYLLGARAEGYDITRSAFPRPASASATPLVDELVEIGVAPLDLYGIPWSSFSGPDNLPTDLPGPWLTGLDAAVAAAKGSGRPVVLALSPLATSFDTLAAEAGETGGNLTLNPSWKPYCYDPGTDGNPTKWRDAYAGYVVWAIRRYQPAFVILGERLNLYEAACGAAPYASLKGFVSEANTRVGAITDVAQPATIVSVDVEDLYGFPKKAGRCVAVTPQACFDTRKGLLDGLDADVVGLESYPAPYVDTLGTIPSDWLSRVVAAAGKPTAVVGTSLPATSMSHREGVCLPILTSSEAIQASWLDQVLATAENARMPLVIWRSLVDLYDAGVVSSCPCAGDTGLCQHLDQLGGAADVVRFRLAGGLVDVDGTERQAAAVWRQAKATP